MSSETVEPESDLQAQYEQRKETIQAIIDECAVNDLDEFGVKTEIARKVGVEDSQVHYVINNWENLIEWRKETTADSFDGADLKEASTQENVDGDVLVGSESESQGMELRQVMGEDVVEEVVGSEVSIDLSLNQVFRVVRDVPEPLGAYIFYQALDEMSKEDGEERGLDLLFENE